MRRLIQKCALMLCALTLAAAAAQPLNERNRKAMAETQYNQSQWNVLYHMGFSEALLKNGYQTEGMRKLAAAVDDTLAWLNARYPEDEITLIRSLDGGTVKSTLHFSATAGEVAFDVYRYAKTGEVYYEETLWGLRHQDELDAYALARLAAAGYTGLTPTLRLDDRMGDQYAPSARLEDVLAGGETCFIRGHLYVPEEQYSEALCQEIGAALTAAGLRGAVTVCAYDREFDLREADAKLPVSTLGLTAHCLVMLKAEEK